MLDVSFLALLLAVTIAHYDLSCLPCCGSANPCPNCSGDSPAVLRITVPVDTYDNCSSHTGCYDELNNHQFDLEKVSECQWCLDPGLNELCDPPLDGGIVTICAIVGQAGPGGYTIGSVTVAEGNYYLEVDMGVSQHLLDLGASKPDCDAWSNLEVPTAANVGAQDSGCDSPVGSVFATAV